MKSSPESGVGARRAWRAFRPCPPSCAKCRTVMRWRWHSSRTCSARISIRSRTGITNTLRLLELAPPVQELVRAGELDMGHARALLALPALKQIELAREGVART